MATKVVKFTYYQIIHTDENGVEQIYDLRIWLANIKALQVADRIRTIAGTKGRLENIGKVSGYYAIRFMRMDDNALSYIVKEAAQAEHLALEDDEYVGLSTTALWESQKGILMLQNNRGGYSIPAIENYLNLTNNEFGGSGILSLRPISDEFTPDNKCQYRSIDIRFANTRNDKLINSKRLGSIIKGFSKVGGVSAHIEIGLAHSGLETMDREEINGIIAELRENEESISTASVKVRSINDAKSAVYDILQNIATDFLYFTIKPRAELGFEYMVRRMGEQFDGKKGRLFQLLGHQTQEE